MEEFNKLKESVDQIKDRNARVEIEKAWEVSKTRIASILIVTYLTSVVLFYILESQVPWINALVPTVGFFLSTQSLSFFKKRWMEKKKKG